MTFISMDIEHLRRLVAYDPNTGALTWLARDHRDCPRDGGKRWNGRYAGREAFRLAENGYRQGMIKRRMFRAHRVAWALYYNEWPSGDIDHINGNRGDNRIENLRIVTRRENARNQRPRCNTKSGTVGVCKMGSRWRAYIGGGAAWRHLGVFNTKQEAVQARLDAQREEGFHENHGVRWSDDSQQEAA